GRTGVGGARGGGGGGRRGAVAGGGGAAVGLRGRGRRGTAVAGRGRARGRRRGGRHGGAGLGALGDDGDGRAHLHRLVLLDEDLDEDAGRRARHLRVHLVGGDLQQRLVLLDVPADSLLTDQHGPIRPALPHLRHHDD